MTAQGKLAGEISEKVGRCLALRDPGRPRKIAFYNKIKSMSRKGACWDNSVGESFCGRLKTERIFFSSDRASCEMTVIPECSCRGSSLIKGLQNGFALGPCGNDGFFSFCKRLNRTRDEAKKDMVDYLEIFYNSRRRHSYLGYLGYVSPRQFEKMPIFTWPAQMVMASQKAPFDKLRANVDSLNTLQFRSC